MGLLQNLKETDNYIKKQQRCYIYTHVSTSMQVDGYSLDAQKDKLHKYADYQDMIIAGEYFDATDIIGLKQNPTNGRRFSPIFSFIEHFRHKSRKCYFKSKEEN